MMIFSIDLDKKSDDELLAISNGRIPHGLLSARSTTTAEDIMIQAKIILQKRQKKSKLWHDGIIILIGFILGIIGTLIVQWIKN
jgi:hypothetical protein